MNGARGEPARLVHLVSSPAPTSPPIRERTTETDADSKASTDRSRTGGGTDGGTDAVFVVIDVRARGPPHDFLADTATDAYAKMLLVSATGGQSQHHASSRLDLPAKPDAGDLVRVGGRWHGARWPGVPSRPKLHARIPAP